MLSGRVTRLLAAVAVILTVPINCAPSNAQGVKRHLFAREFYKVSDTLYCGSELDSQENVKKLKELGIKTIIDLRVFTGVETESGWAKNEGVDYVHISTGFMLPNDSRIKEVVSMVEDPKCQPVYLHCRTGCDRTGVIVGLYRVDTQGWTKKQAYKEMRDHHFRPVFFGMKHSFDGLTSQYGKAKRLTTTSWSEAATARD